MFRSCQLHGRHRLRLRGIISPVQLPNLLKSNFLARPDSCAYRETRRWEREKEREREKARSIWPTVFHCVSYAVMNEARVHGTESPGTVSNSATEIQLKKTTEFVTDVSVSTLSLSTKRTEFFNSLISMNISFICAFLFL